MAAFCSILMTNFKVFFDEAQREVDNIMRFEVYDLLTVWYTSNRYYSSNMQVKISLNIFRKVHETVFYDFYIIFLLSLS